MSHTISVEHGHVTVTCTRCETVIVVPEQDDPAIAGLQALELHLYHLTTHHEKAE